MTSPASSPVTLAATGSYPRSGPSPELQVLHYTREAAGRGERTAADVASAEREMTRRAIKEQVRAGIELLTDGQIRWRDPISYFAGRMEGVVLRNTEPGHAPALTARPVRRAPLLVEDYLFATNALGSVNTPPQKEGRLRLKPVLTGPYTLARACRAEDAAMNTLEARAEAFAEAVAAEIADLAAAGAAFIQVDEPAILAHPGDWEVFAAAWSRLAALRGPKLRLALYVGDGDAAPLYDRLTALPVDLLGLDFTVNPQLADVVSTAGSPVPLGLGLVSGRTETLEDPAGAARKLTSLLAAITGNAAHLGTSCGLDGLPWDAAAAKLALLAKIRTLALG